MHCTSCGAPIPENGSFCPGCGRSLTATANPGAGVSSAAAPASARVPDPAPVVAAPRSTTGGFTAGSTGGATAGAMADNVAGMLCYPLGFITGILFLVLEPYKAKPFVRFHAWQSIYLSVVWFGVWIVEQAVLATLSWRLWALMGLLIPLIGLLFLALVVYLMVQAYQGKAIRLPVIGDLAAKRQ